MVDLVKINVVLLLFSCRERFKVSLKIILIDVCDNGKIKGDDAVNSLI